MKLQDKEKEKEQERVSFQMIMQGIQDLKVKMDTIEQRTGRMEQMMEKYEERLQNVEEGGKQREEKIGNIDNRLTAIEQEKRQDLVAVMIEILAGALEITEEKMMDGVDEIYRVFTRYAMRNKLPREIHVRFTKKTIKTQILQVARDKGLKYKGKEIMVLKQVPRRVREMRREYRFLTKKLLEKDVNYRWLIPEGLMFIWQEQRHRIDSIEKAEIFHNKFFGRREIETEKETFAIEPQEDQMRSGKEEGAVGGQMETKEQHEVRSTRTVRPKYKT
uniref:L1 transposable element RRM domain-containing protein n=1 Tax=Pseudonaja textilis TaxID=8673 RepID=A0A670YPM3_PSETE